MPTSQIGKLGETLFATQLMLASGGRLSPFLPLVDDDGVDLILFDKVTAAALTIQVKTRTQVDNEKAQTVEFNVRRATFTDRTGAYTLGILLGERGQDIRSAWLIPNAKLEAMSNGKRDKFVLTPSAKATSRDRYAEYRCADMDTVCARLILVLDGKGEGLQQVEQAQMTCQQWNQQYSSSWEYQTPTNYQTVKQICEDAEVRRLHYNQLVEEYNVALEQQRVSSLFNDHPANQNRVAAIAALNDYLAGRRDLQSIAKYQQSHRVMVALNQIDSVLLKAPVKPDLKVSAKDAPQPQRQATDRKLADELKELKHALDQGFITRVEYERKRTDVVERY